MREVLEKFTYQDYKNDVQHWLKSGRFVWYISGNYSHDGAIQLVEETRKMFNLKNTLICDLPLVKTAQPDKGIAYCVEVPLEDDSNDNSCVLTYFETGAP